MYNEYFNRIQSLSDSQIREVTLWVASSIEIETEEEIFSKLNILLSDKTSNELFQFRNSYTRWLAMCGWDLFYSLTPEEMLNIVSKYTIIGLLGEENVWKKIITYLHNRFLDQESMEENYATLRESFLHSQEVLYIEDSDVPYTLSRFITESNLPNVINDSLSESEFLSRFQEKIRQRIHDEGYETDAFQVTGRIRDLINFFTGIKPNRIWYIVDPYFYPQQYTEDAIASRSKNRISAEESLGEEENFLSSVSSNVKENTQLQEGFVSYRDISKKIKDSVQSLAVDEKDEQIIMQLGELSEQYKDEKIRDLYYYDEQSGTFVWNDELLKQS